MQRKFKVGDKVQGKTTGRLYTLKERAPELDGPRGKAWRHDDIGWVGESQIKLVERISNTEVTRQDVVSFLKTKDDGELLNIIEEVRD